MNIETIFGDLRAHAQFEPGTFQDFDELSRDQLADPSLLKKAFYVSTFPLYTARGGEPVLAFARHTTEHPNNLVLVHIDDPVNSSYKQLVKMGNFRPDPDEAQAVLEATDTFQAKLRDFRLSGNDPVYRFLAIRTADGFVKDGDKYKRPREVEQAAIVRVGYTEEFLAMLHREPFQIGKTRLYVLPPDYVAVKAGEQFVGRAAWRYSFFSNAYSDAYDHFVNFLYGLRGVPLVAPAGDALEKGVPPAPPETSLLDYDRAYQTVLAHPEKLTPERADGLARLVADFLKK